VLELVTNPPDLDGDGQPDVVRRSPGGRESTHLLYVVGAGSCARFVSRIEACSVVTTTFSTACAISGSTRG
jgi:hypothetical protein